MSMERTLRLIAGVMVLISVALVYFVSPWWLLFTVFIGVNLFQSGITDWCPMMAILRKLQVGQAQTTGEGGTPSCCAPGRS